MALVTATLWGGGAGRVAVLTDRHAATQALRTGEVDRLVVLGGPAPSPLPPPLAERLFWYALPDASATDLASPRSAPPEVRTLAWGAPLELLAALVLGSPRAPHGDRAPAAEPPRTWPPCTLPACCLVPARLVALCDALNLSLRVVFSGPPSDVGLCTSSGRVRAISAAGGLDAEALRDDPAVALLLGLRARGPHPGRGLTGDLAFIADHAEVFGGSLAFRRQAIHAMAWILGHAAESVSFVAAPTHLPGLAVRELLRAALLTLSAPALDALRCAAPPDDPDPDPDDLDHDARVEATLAALAAPLWRDRGPPTAAPRALEPLPRARTPRGLPRTGQRLRVPTVRGLSGDDGACSNADPAGLLEALALARARMERDGRVTPLPGTRLEPVGLDLDDLLLFFRLEGGPLGDTLIGALRGPRGVAIPVAVRELRRLTAQSPAGAAALAVDPALPRALSGVLDRVRQLRHPNLAHVLELRHVGDLSGAAVRRSRAGLPANWVVGGPLVCARQGAVGDAADLADLVVTDLHHGLSLAAVLEHLDTIGEPLPAQLALWIAACVGRGLEAARHPEDGDDGPLLLGPHGVDVETVLVGFDGSVKLDVSLGVARALGAKHGAADDTPRRRGRSLALALARRAQAGVLAAEPELWLAGAVELALALVQRNEAHLLNMMGRCATHMLRLRVPVRRAPLRLFPER